MLNKYMRDITELTKGGLLTAEEEIALAKRIEDGDVDALNTLVERNLPLVIYIAKKHKSRSVSFDDMVAEGNIGLIVAAQKFDYRKECRFSTYAWFWIESKILRFKYSSTCVGSYAAAALFFKIKRLRESHYRKTGTNMTNSEICSALDINMSKLREIMDVCGVTITSIDEPVTDDGNTLADTIASDEPSHEDTMIDQEHTKSVLTILNQCPHLDERERRIITTYFGIGMTHESTLASVAKKLGISSGRCTQLYQRALRKLKCHVARNKISEALI